MAKSCRFPSYLGEISADGRAERANRLANRRGPGFAVLQLDIDQLRIDDLALDLMLLGHRHQPRRIGFRFDQRPRRDGRLPTLVRSQEDNGAVAQSVRNDHLRHQASRGLQPPAPVLGGRILHTGLGVTWVSNCSQNLWITLWRTL